MRFDGRNKPKRSFPPPQWSRKRKAGPLHVLREILARRIRGKGNLGGAPAEKFDFVAPAATAEQVTWPPMETPAPRHRPPDSVALVARTHWLVGAVALLSVGLLHVLTQGIPRVGFGLRTYAITLGLGVLYVATGTMVWFGTPLGRACNHVCSLLYLVRPQLGDRIWRIARSPEFKAHFTRAP